MRPKRTRTKTRTKKIRMKERTKTRTRTKQNSKVNFVSASIVNSLAAAVALMLGLLSFLLMAHPIQHVFPGLARPRSLDDFPYHQHYRFPYCWCLLTHLLPLPPPRYHRTIPGSVMCLLVPGLTLFETPAVGSFISIGDNLVALIISSVPEVCRAPPPSYTSCQETARTVGRSHRDKIRAK